ncbi:hypothetical protein KAR91_61090 [Candidatus Pacearchaeota archaeon]|nr:hypothetical protein [Candidatus Pacearchaeota archaeon]
MKTIHTKAICITFVLEWHSEMFIVFHRGNAKKHYNSFGVSAFGLPCNMQIGDIIFLAEIPLFSIRNQILNKFVNASHDKYNIYRVLDDDLIHLHRHISRTAIKELSPVCHIWNSKGRPVP